MRKEGNFPQIWLGGCEFNCPALPQPVLEIRQDRSYDETKFLGRIPDDHKVGGNL
jgi:hypothetical protein